MGARKPASATPLSLERMAEILVDAYEVVFPGERPTMQELAWLFSIARIENANGRSIIQHNWGNRVAGKNDDYWVPSWADSAIPDDSLSANALLTRERLERGEQVPRAFAAYPDHMTGAEKFLSLFRLETHARIREAAKKGDFEAFWRGLWVPHPVTKKVYCVECGNQATHDAYEQVTRDSARFFRDFSVGKAEGEGVGYSLVSPSPSASGSLVELPSVRLGDRGPAVSLVQAMLGARVDAKFGPRTCEKVVTFQRKMRLNGDGAVGPKTWRALIEFEKGTLSNGQNS